MKPLDEVQARTTEPGIPSAPNARRPWSVLPDAVYFFCLAVLLLTYSLLLVWRPLVPHLDFWGHAAIGRLIWQTGHTPNRTLFLWTADQPWVYHSWLAQLFFYGLTNVGRPQDLPYVVLAVTFLLVILPFILVCLVWRWEGRLSSWIAIPILLAMQGLVPVFVTRPELFTVLFLCLLLMFLVYWRGVPDLSRPSQVPARDKLGLAAILVLFVVWANTHGGVVIGVLVLAVTAVCDLVQDGLTPRSRVLALVALLAPLAVCANPYGLSYWQALRPVASYTFAHILEWLPVWKGQPPPDDVLIAAVVVVSLAAMSWIMNPDRRWAQMGWLVLLGFLFVQARRNVWPFVLTCLMVLAANARTLDPETLWRKITRWFTRRHNGKEAPSIPDLVSWPVRMFLLGWVFLEFLHCIVIFRPWQPLVPTRLEQGAVRFIQDHKLEGKIVNDYENASYLHWGLAESLPLYIDSFNAYPDAVMRDYHDLVGQTNRGRRLLDEQQIEIVLLTTNRGGGAPTLATLAGRLDADAQWVRVYAGGDGVIWVRRTPEYKHIWGPLSRSVSKVSFALLERWGREEQYVAPAIVEDHGRGEIEDSKPGAEKNRPRKD